MNEEIKNIFREELRKELKKEFEKQLNVQINEQELKNVMKEYKKIKKFQKTPLYQVMKMDKNSKK